jgi:hypothetical protein
MAVSGIKLDPLCIEEFNNMKLKHKYRYIIFKLSDDHKSITIDKLGAKDETFDDFLQYMKEVKDKSDCRYATYDVEYDVSGALREKIVFILWAPDDSNPKKKMLYSSSQEALKKPLEGISGKALQANDLGDLTWEALRSKCD